MRKGELEAEDIEAMHEGTRQYIGLLEEVEALKRDGEPISHKEHEVRELERVLIQIYHLSEGQLLRIRKGLGIKTKTDSSKKNRERVLRNLSSLFERLGQEFPEFRDHLVTPGYTKSGNLTFHFDRALKKVSGQGTVKYDPNEPVKWKVIGA